MAFLELTETQLEPFEFARGLSVEAVGAEKIQQVLADLKPVLGSALVIGGLAVNYHGYVRATTDVDILYADSDEYRILERLATHFKIVLKSESGWHHLEHRGNGVRLELIPETGLTTYGFIPSPKTFVSDNGFLPLDGLMWLKLVSGRSKDDADIIELAKIRMADVLATRAKLPVELHERFDELIARANREMQHDPGRRPK